MERVQSTAAHRIATDAYRMAGGRRRSQFCNTKLMSSRVNKVTTLQSRLVHSIIMLNKSHVYTMHTYSRTPTYMYIVFTAMGSFIGQATVFNSPSLNTFQYKTPQIVDIII